jgi:hypothetical protein
MLPDESVCRRGLPGDALLAAYSPVFGGILTGSAFHAAAAALMLKTQRSFASPVPDNPHGLRLCQETGAASLQAIRCVSFDCSNQPATFTLTKANL